VCRQQPIEKAFSVVAGRGGKGRGLWGNQLRPERFGGRAREAEICRDPLEQPLTLRQGKRCDQSRLKPGVVGEEGRANGIEASAPAR